MSIDRYTKLLLTVIAVCLLWMSLGGPSLLPAASAQQGGAEVVIVGWRDATGETWPLPTALAPLPSTNSSFAARESWERQATALRNRGVALPVADR